MIPSSIVFWNGSKGGHNFLLSFRAAAQGPAPLKRASTHLRMLPAGWTAAVKEMISLHCRNSNEERAPRTAEKPRCPWSNSRGLQAKVVLQHHRHEFLFLKSPDYRLVPFVLSFQSKFIKKYWNQPLAEICPCQPTTFCWHICLKQYFPLYRISFIDCWNRFRSVSICQTMFRVEHHFLPFNHHNKYILSRQSG